MFPQVSTPLTAAAPVVARPPVAAAPAPMPALAPANLRQAKVAHWRAAAFSMFADDQAQGPFSLWPRGDAAAKVAVPKPPAKKKGKAPPAAAAADDAEEMGSQMGKQNMRFRSALEQVSYYTNESAFHRGE